jgi:hypothetical protein
MEIKMDETKLVEETFNQMDESEIALVLSQAARRILEMRHDYPDSIFWGSVLNRISRWTLAIPKLILKEKKLVLEAKRIPAIKHFRDRTGTRLLFACDIVDTWIIENSDLVDEEIYTKACDAKRRRQQ